eukprot:CAMPEP_0197317694 /NCGR_PEP_ID=MMETSP0891-20130614/48124_1 /TAXON_ID=44058 ORGANISM="Aureoumbra lagunensis, Strain CCMP1510" /NCGR_SAMPLE_ID=MMETSP0891 /ASSEMBLY_ACC=CAM_ASM_000534 /LENGTH=109 /DNA_ID=CAMNT_0042807805 /DNA_START=183 /DNA_END=512 /DNA_ORIENTATION=-
MASILVKYAIQEPGVNWVDEKFRRKESMPYSSGWQLPIEWADKIIQYGILELSYSSTGRGCKPDHTFRRTLYPLFLCGRKYFADPSNTNDDVHDNKNSAVPSHTMSEEK